MTIAEFGEYAGTNPLLVILFFGFIIVFALVAGFIGKGEGHLSPWKHLYAALIYLTCIPAIFIVFMSLYALIFEGASISNVNVVTHIFPVISMVATLSIIKSNVSLDRVPGFNKISGFIIMVIAASVLVAILMKMRLIVFSYMPIQQVGLIFLVIFAVIYFGWRKVMSKS